VLRVRPDQLKLRELDGAIELRFFLPAGSFATVLVAELFAGSEIEEGSGA